MMKYTQVYTRENCLLALQIWEEHQTKTIKDILGWSDNPIIFNVRKGVARVYYYDLTFSEYESNIARCVSEDIQFIEKTMRWYGEILDYLEPIWKSGNPLQSKEELFEFYDQALMAWCGLDVSYVVPLMSDVSDDDRQLAMSMRERAVDFLEEIDHVFQKTLGALYPELGDLVKYISITDMKSGNIFPGVLEQRREHYILFDFKIYVDTDIRELIQRNGIALEEEIAPRSVSELRGQIAMRGSVKGRVRVLHNKSQIPELQKGEILVTAMTTPDYLPAMKNATAIITDEGGITCHAAIVAREMKKPCIIGTKIATQVLHDGDLVEVDAENGVVRIIERARE